MITRRGFFQGGAASVMFCSCGMLDHARAREPAPQRLPVKVRGKRIKTIDVHAHCNIREAVDLMGDDAKGVIPRPKSRKSRASSRSKSASRAWTEWRSTWRCCRSIHSGTARTATPRRTSSRSRTRSWPNCARRKPDRFAAFASLSMQFPDLAVVRTRDRDEEARLPRRGDRRQRVRRGFCQPASIGSGEGRRARRGAVHSPAEQPQLAARFRGNGWLSNTIGNRSKPPSRCKS